MFKNHPKGLLAAAISNMGERFGYYIMNAVLVLFLCSKFGLSDETSAIIYSVFYCGIYVLSLVGGIIADRMVASPDLFRLVPYSFRQWPFQGKLAGHCGADV